MGIQVSETRRLRRDGLKLLDNQQNERMKEIVNNPELAAYIKQQDSLY
jgi:hypothetical protein